jgi:hypothetical protein
MRNPGLLVYPPNEAILALLIFPQQSGLTVVGEGHTIVLGGDGETTYQAEVNEVFWQ